jgi:hypothetical protein
MAVSTEGVCAKLAAARMRGPTAMGLHERSLGLRLLAVTGRRRIAGHPSHAMSENPKKPAGSHREQFPSNDELLHELRRHGAKPPPREIPAVSRRTRDFLLIAGVGSAIIGFATFRVLGNSEPTTVKMALTGIAVFCGLTWYIFYGVMSRY